MTVDEYVKKYKYISAKKIAEYKGFECYDVERYKTLVRVVNSNTISVQQHTVGFPLFLLTKEGEVVREATPDECLEIMSRLEDDTDGEEE